MCLAERAEVAVVAWGSQQQHQKDLPGQSLIEPGPKEPQRGSFAGLMMDLEVVGSGYQKASGRVGQLQGADGSLQRRERRCSEAPIEFLGPGVLAEHAHDAGMGHRQHQQQHIAELELGPKPAALVRLAAFPIPPVLARAPLARLSVWLLDLALTS